MASPLRQERASQERMGSEKAGLALQMLLSGLMDPFGFRNWLWGKPDTWLTLGAGPPGFGWVNGLPFSRSPMYPIARLMERRLIDGRSSEEYPA